VNLLVFLLFSLLSIHPTIQESNPRAGLAQAAIVATYCTYLTLSAVSMEPDDQQCNPLVRANGARTATVVLGAVVTMLTIAYTTTRAATQGFAFGSSASGSHIRLPDEEEEPQHGLVDQQPRNTRREMSAEVLRRAIAEGSLPADAMDADDDDDEDGQGNRVGANNDDEKAGTQYNYSLFHVIFLLGTCWVATLLTQSLNDVEMVGVAPVGRSYWASWVKIGSSWMCYAVYGWSLLAPVVLPERFGY
ncbi:MAG: hypothetical protein LQ340_006885, partial [Diploschistes diacapsis]